jgi:transglutaminase-like putative cysteine protease
MKETFKVRDIDYLALGLMMGLSILFMAPAMTWSHFFVMFVINLSGIFLWVALRTGRELKAGVRILTTVMFLYLLKTFKIFPAGLIGSVFFYFSLFIIFSTKQTRGGACLRACCGIFSVIALTLAWPPLVALPIVLIFVFLFIGSLISTWSGMPLKDSILWFAKRSVRKETVFLILFLGGISAIGLRQAQDYAERQSELTGLSRNLSPGSMKNLMLSPSVALRVTFPEPVELSLADAYFRGAVMDQFLGFSWTPGLSRVRPRLLTEPSDINYHVAISPRYNDFIPALDYGVVVQTDDPVPIHYSLRTNGVFQSIRRSESWNYYSAFSRKIPVHNLDSEDMQYLLRTPKNVDPRIMQLAVNMRGDGGVSEFVKGFAEYVKKNEFQYSLEPGQNATTLADFLFKGRRGACEHYAAAGASLARFAGIPSRVVAGFLGGAWDEARLRLFVRDLDAHAWVELWDTAGNQWVRFDPVTYVAPDRVLQGAEYYLRSIGADIPDENSMQQKIMLAAFFMELDNWLAMLNGGYASSMASSFVEYGEELALVGAFGLFISFFILRIRRFIAERKSPEKNIVRGLTKILIRLGEGKKCGEPMDVWLGRVSGSHDYLADDLDDFSAAYRRYCYGKSPVRSDVKVMEAAFNAVRQKILFSALRTK